MGMRDPIPQFSHFVSQLAARHPSLAYIHVVEARVKGYMTVPPEEYDPRKSNDFIRKIWSPRPLISCGAYSRGLALEIAESKGDIIGVGRPWISNVSGLFHLRSGHCRGGMLCAMLTILFTARPGGTAEE